MVLHSQSLNHTFRIHASRIHLVDAINVDCRNVNGFRVEFSRLDDFLHFSDDSLSGHSHIGVEVSRSLMEL
jgi:hypothetical protein